MIYIPVSRTFLHKMWSPSPTPRGKQPVQRVNDYPTGQFSSTDSVPYYLLSHPPQTFGDWKLREVKIAGVLSPRHNYQQRFRINFKVFWTADKIIREFILSVMLGKETPKREKKDILISEWNSNSRPHHRMRSLLFHQPTELKTSIMHRHI